MRRSSDGSLRAWIECFCDLCSFFFVFRFFLIFVSFLRGCCAGSRFNLIFSLIPFLLQVQFSNYD